MSTNENNDSIKTKDENMNNTDMVTSNEQNNEENTQIDSKHPDVTNVSHGNNESSSITDKESSANPDNITDDDHDTENNANKPNSSEGENNSTTDTPSGVSDGHEKMQVDESNTNGHSNENNPITPIINPEQTDPGSVLPINDEPQPPTPPPPPTRHSSCQFRADKIWLDPQYDDKSHLIKKPDELGNDMDEPSGQIDETILNRIQGSIIGMALGDALGAHVEFRPHEYLVQNPVTDLSSGGTWGLEKGQFTDDTSMALCLANSLIARRDFNAYDQLVRYKWWYKLGYMSSTGKCFDIGAATRQSIQEFEHRQKNSSKLLKIPFEDIDYLFDLEILKDFDVYCSEDEVAGNGALMRLAPVPLFFHRLPKVAVEYSGYSGKITHGDTKAYDACRYYGALIVAALHGYTKEKLLDNDFYSKHKDWFGKTKLHSDIESIAKGSYKRKNGYADGIRGKGYIVAALEAALWAFWSDDNSFEKGALAAVNLGDDTDTTAAIYGQLAGAYYGYKELPSHWLKHAHAKVFMEKLSKWIVYEGECWCKQREASISQESKGSI